MMIFIETIENTIAKEVLKDYMPMQAGDVPITFADIDSLYKEVEFKPDTNIEYGVPKMSNQSKVFN